MNGQIIDQIATIRHSERGTVMDHPIGQTLFFDDFPYEWAFSAETIERLEPNEDSVQEWCFSEWSVDGQLGCGESRLCQIYPLRRGVVQNANKRTKKAFWV